MLVNQAVVDIFLTGSSFKLEKLPLPDPMCIILLHIDTKVQATPFKTLPLSQLYYRYYIVPTIEIISFYVPDVITIEKTAENFRLIYDVKGRFTVHRITPVEAQVRKYMYF